MTDATKPLTNASESAESRPDTGQNKPKTEEEKRTELKAELKAEILKEAEEAKLFVKATRVGYFAYKRRRKGEIFPIKFFGEFSSKWMEKSKGNWDEAEKEHIAAEKVRMDRKKKENKE